jgi:hypothetical protein
MKFQQKLQLAIQLNASAIGRQAEAQESILRRVLNEQELIVDSMKRGEVLLSRLNEHVNFVAMRPLSDRIEAGKLLAGFLGQFEANAAEPLVRQFYTSSDGDYTGSRDSSQPIDETKVKGVSGELLRVLRLVEIEIEWLPRTNGLTASFQLKVS